MFAIYFVEYERSILFLFLLLNVFLSPFLCYRDFVIKTADKTILLLHLGTHFHWSFVDYFYSIL